MASTLPYICAEDLQELEQEIANTKEGYSPDLDSLQRTVLLDLIRAHRDLQAVYAVFHIGSAARLPHVLMENARNALRRSNCLTAIERELFTVETPPDPDEGNDEPGEECLLRWGDEPADYVERFRKELPGAVSRGLKGRELTDEQVDRILSTQIPGGSAARDWFLPHEQPRGLANVRDVVRRMVAVANGVEGKKNG